MDRPRHSARQPERHVLTIAGPQRCRSTPGDLDHAARHRAATGRLFLAVLFLSSGLGKIAAPAMTQALIAAAGLPAPLLAYGAAIVVEVGGGVLLLIGYRSRLAALALAAFTLLAAVAFHADFGDQNQLIHFLKNLAIAGGLMQVAAFGAGALSVDGWRRGVAW